MRRADREITEIKDILSVIDKCRVMRVAMRDENEELYIVPVNFGYEYENEKLKLYFHSAKEGRKLDIIRANPDVAFEMDCDNGVKGDDVPCDYTCFYESVIGNGRAEILSGSEEKIKALKIMMKSITGRDFEMGEKEAGSVAVVKITAEKFSCKKH